MADIRALLRAERATRAAAPKTPAPNAPPTTPQSDLPHPDEPESSARPSHNRTISASSTAGHKRKAGESVGQDASSRGDNIHAPEHSQTRADVDDSRKRARSDQAGEPTTGDIHHHALASTEVSGPQAGGDGASAPVAQSLPAESLDEHQWAAFQQEMADLASESQPPPPQPPLDPFSNGHTSKPTAGVIVAQPSTAAGASTDDDKSRNPPDTTINPHIALEKELAEAREDAKRALQQELDEMDRLDDKVKRLHQMREAIRQKGQLSNGQPNGSRPSAEAQAGAESDESDGDDGDLTWGLGRT